LWSLDLFFSSSAFFFNFCGLITLAPKPAFTTCDSSRFGLPTPSLFVPLALFSCRPRFFLCYGMVWESLLLFAHLSFQTVCTTFDHWLGLLFLGPSECSGRLVCPHLHLFDLPGQLTEEHGAFRCPKEFITNFFFPFFFRPFFSSLLNDLRIAFPFLLKDDFAKILNFSSFPLPPPNRSRLC